MLVLLVPLSPSWSLLVSPGPFSCELLYRLASWAAPGSAGGLHLLDLGFEAGRPARCEAEVDLTNAEMRSCGSLDLFRLVYRSAATLHTLYLRDDYPWLKAGDLQALKNLSALAHLQIRLPSDFQREHLPDVCQPGLVSLYIQGKTPGIATVFWMTPRCPAHPSTLACAFRPWASHRAFLCLSVCLDR